MIEEKYMLKTLISMFEKYDILLGLENNSNFDGLNYSEVHTIDLIGKIEDNNVMLLSKKMNMTKGALSKITKKLLEKDLITSYKKPNNKKEIFFKLTQSGLVIYENHKKIHEEALERDKEIFTSFNQEERNTILNFMNKVIEDIDFKIDSASK